MVIGVIAGTAIGSVVGVASGQVGSWMGTGAALGVTVGYMRIRDRRHRVRVPREPPTREVRGKAKASLW